VKKDNYFMDHFKLDREFLKAKGAPTHIVEKGLAGLVETWEKVVASVRQGYPLGLDDYLNDMDGRQLLEETLAVVPETKRQKIQGRVEKTDALMHTLVKPTPKCLWGEKAAQEEGWTREKNWWYFFQPLEANPELLAEIKRL
jgi:hypothetical protein